MARHQLNLGQLLADHARHAHREIRVAAARGSARGYLPPHDHRLAVRHPRTRPRMESAGVAAPAAITRYPYAMALPSPGRAVRTQAAANGTASGGWR